MSGSQPGDWGHRDRSDIGLDQEPGSMGAYLEVRSRLCWSGIGVGWSLGLREPLVPMGAGLVLGVCGEVGCLLYSPSNVERVSVSSLGCLALREG